MKLPTKKTPPKTDLGHMSVLLYGPAKSGKTTFCSKIERCLYLASEAGLNALETYQVLIESWEDLLVACGLLHKGEHEFNTIIVDTVDNLHPMCVEYICQKHGVEHESDLPYGKGYALVHTEFKRVLTKLSMLPYGLYLISHSQIREIETRTGKYTRSEPMLPGKARQLVVGLVDLVLFVDEETVKGEDGKMESRRVLRTKPSLAYEAGDRTGRLPETVEFSYPAFLEAFKKAQGGERRTRG